MPYLNITAAQQELDAELEPAVAEIRGRTFTFPGSMPAAVEIAQMEAVRATEQMEAGEEAPAETTERLLRACLADQYQEVWDYCTQREIGDLLGWLLDTWAGQFQDPNRMRPRMERLRGMSKPVAERGTSNGSSSRSSGRSKRISNGNTGSTSRGPSTDLIEVAPGKWAGAPPSPGGGSSRSTGDSPAKR